MKRLLPLLLLALGTSAARAEGPTALDAARWVKGKLSVLGEVSDAKTKLAKTQSLSSSEDGCTWVLRANVRNTGAQQSWESVFTFSLKDLSLASVQVEDDVSFACTESACIHVVDGSLGDTGRERRVGQLSIWVQDKRMAPRIAKAISSAIRSCGGNTQAEPF
jgi:hypothetical protein